MIRAINSALVTTLLSVPGPAGPAGPPPQGPDRLSERPDLPILDAGAAQLSLARALSGPQGPGLPGPAGATVAARPITHSRRWRAIRRTKRAILRMVRAGNKIARRPYTYGGGHGSFASSGYDCSGSVSYLLHAAGLISAPQDSTELMSFGRRGPGRHVTVYANAQHALLTINGRRFDTIAFKATGSRWASSRGSLTGYVVRHPPGF